MTKEEIEKLLKRVIKVNESLAYAQEAMSMTNGTIVDMILALNVRQQDDDSTPPTIQ